MPRTAKLPSLYFVAPLMVGAVVVGGMGLWLQVTEPVRAAKRCREAISNIAQAECEYALRHDHYTLKLGEVEQFATSRMALHCPFDHQPYAVVRVVGLANTPAPKSNTNPNLLISCPNAAEHAKASGQLLDYQKLLCAPSVCGL